MSKLIIVIVSLILVFIFVILIFLPKYRDFRILKAQVLEKQTELSQREEYLAQLEFLDKKLEKYSQELTKIGNAIPLEPELPSLFGFLQQSCSQNGLVFKEIKGFKISSSEDLKGFQQTTIKFEIAGTVSALLDFLKKVEKSARLIEISSVNFKSPEKGDVFVFEMEVRVYSRK